MTTAELAQTAKQIIERKKDKPKGQETVVGLIQMANNAEPSGVRSEIPELPLPKPATPMPTPVPEPSMEGMKPKTNDLIGGLKRVRPDLFQPQQVPVASPGPNPAVTQIESQLNAMDEAPAAIGLVDRAKAALRGFGMYGGMDPAKAQVLEQNSRQMDADNQFRKRQALVEQLKMIQDRERQADQDARQRGQDYRDEQFQGVQARNIEDQIRERNEPKPVQAPAPRPIDPLSPEGIQARVNFENQRPKDTPAPTRPDYEWVTRNGQPVQIQKGTAQPGDRPYDATAARQAGTGQTSPYSAERAKRTKDSVDQLAAKVSRWTVGAGSMLSGIPETEARSFRAELDTLKSNIAFNELAQMREASKTGGALGAVSDRELRLLESALGALDTGQKPEDFKVQLQKIKESIERWETAQAMQNAPGNNVTTAKDPLGVR